jgi:phosphohistidine phosphatase
MPHWYIMRHAHAEPGAPMDETRTITKKGEKQCRHIRQFLDDIGVEFDIVFCSPFIRAEETARLMKGKADYVVLLPELEPDGNPDIAWQAIEYERYDAHAHVLIVTHDPLVQPLLAAACFGFSADHNLFDHGNIVHLDGNEFRWWMTPKLAAKMEYQAQEAEREFAQANQRLSESLQLEHKARAVNPLIEKMMAALRQRWERQAKRFKAGEKWDQHDQKFASKYSKIRRAAYQQGAKHVHAQIVNFKEAKAKPKLKTITLEPDEDVRGFEVDLDQTTTDRLDTLRNSGLSDAALAVAAAALFKGFSDPEESGAVSRAETAALDAVSSAYHEGGRDLAAEFTAGGNGDLEKSWDTEADPCDDCDGNSAMGWIDSEAPFDTGDFEPPAHPNCRCSVSYRPAGEAEED